MDPAPPSVAQLERRIAVLNEVGQALSSENSPHQLLERILSAAMMLTSADGGTIYEIAGDRLRFAIIHNQTMGVHLGMSGVHAVPLPEVPLRLPDGSPNHASVVAHCVLTGQTLNIPDAYHAVGFDFTGTRAFDARTGYRSTSFLTVPMRDHEGEITGVLQLINARDPAGLAMPFPAADQALVESLASQAATARSKHRLIEEQRQLFESFIRLIANAIDDKSPHTGGHCRRVPELTMLLAEAAARSPRAGLGGFTLSDDDRYELRVAAWLHDCGKITTPEWVMEKATKLHTLFDRIELIATRFAAAKAQAEARAARAVACGAADAVAVAAEAQAEAARLDDELAFLRRCNTGGEAMRGEDQERVRAIARRTWIDPAGAERPLLSDDEVDNLCIARGTLLPREREVINNHIVATIRMLESLPFPRPLKRVPEYAGGHHERMDGRGYPKGLKREQMSVPARIMGIADVFEALTAADRPYKRAMTLGESLRILGRMAQDGHIDPDLFDIFVRERVYQAYAHQFLKPEQIDEIDERSIPGYRA